MRTPRRRTIICIIAATLFFIVVGSAWVEFLSSTGKRVTQARFDRIHKGMSLNEVSKLVDGSTFSGLVNDINSVTFWDGPNYVWVALDHAKVTDKQLHVANFRETLEWYAKKCAKAAGISWK
jgi:hypothetical protein